MQTKIYRQQHGDMRRELNDLRKTIMPLQPEEARARLARLAGLLKIHLAMEDRALYPRMLTHGDPEVRQTAGEYQQSMGNLAQAFEAFYERWRKHGEIEAHASEYADAYQALAQALNRRMDLEDKNLYDLVDEKVDLAS